MAKKKIEGTERMYYDAATKTIYERMENGDFNPIKIGGSALVSAIGISGLTQTQTAIALGASRVRKTFDPPIKALSVEVAAGAGTTDPDEAVLLCFDAPTTGVADDWLTETNTAPREAIKPSDGIQRFYFGGASVTYVDLIAKGTTPDLDVTLKGVS